MQVSCVLLESLISASCLEECKNDLTCYVVSCIGGELGEEWIHVYIRLSPFTVHLKLTTLLISYIPVQNKKFEKILSQNKFT